MVTRILAALGLALALVRPAVAGPVELEALWQARWADGEGPPAWLYSASGLHRYGTDEQGATLGQALVTARAELATALSAQAVVHLNSDPEVSPGFSEAFLRYKPLSASRYRWQLEVGAFYPALSLENPDIGWTSPYLYTNSAINSWVGEELRTLGAEFTFSRPGRRFRSPHSFELSAAVFKANDPAGSLLSWRGVALHDRQTTLNETLDFAPNPAFSEGPLRRQANYVEPFSEVDGRFGYYLGGHWGYRNRSDVRIYYYDNNGDPAAFNPRTGQYGWDTCFVSVAWQYRFTRSTRLIAQWLEGNTVMGPTRGVDNDFRAGFVLLSHQWGKHRLSARYDDFRVIDRDHWPYYDPNDSNGESLALAWRYDVSRHWQVGAEVLQTDSYAENRYWWSQPLNQSHSQWMLNLQYRF